MDLFKKVIAVLLVAALTVTTLTITVSAEEPPLEQSLMQTVFSDETLENIVVEAVETVLPLAVNDFYNDFTRMNRTLSDQLWLFVYIQVAVNDDAEIDSMRYFTSYYNPECGRFINADEPEILEMTQGDILGANLYAYGNNNLVNCSFRGKVKTIN